jgi:hypothetical protein
MAANREKRLIINMKNIRFNDLNMHRSKCPPSPRVCRNYSETKAINPQLHQYFITGFCDGESSFMVRVERRKNGWVVQASFAIGLSNKDKALLKLIQSTFGGVGGFCKGSTIMQFRVSSIKDLINVIIPHFDKYPLLTQKHADFKLFKRVVELMANKEHLTPEGLQEIVNLKASINKGLPDKLKAAFPDTKPVQRPVVELRSIPDPNWIAGFTSAEGCFHIKTSKSSTNKLGLQVQLKFVLTQHYRDKELLKSLITYLDCGNVSEGEVRD